MNKRERLETCLSGEVPDRCPVALWRHFPVDDQTAEGLAKATLMFQKNYDFDLIKVTPSSSYCVKDWGVKDEWKGNTEGTREYYHRVIVQSKDWQNLNPLDPRKGELGKQLECLRLLKKEVGPHTPIIQTIFSPLSQAKNLVGMEKLISHLRQYPELLHDGLKIIADATSTFIEQCLSIGIDGIFFAVQHASYDLLSLEEFREFGVRYDKTTLEPALSLWLNMVHIHGENIMFEEVLKYPISIINWHDRHTTPSLSEARESFTGVLCGGLQRYETMVLGNPESVYKEAKDSIRTTKGRQFILGTGCVLPITSPHSNIMAARNAVNDGGLA